MHKLKWEEYKLKTGLNVTLEDFMTPSILRKLHSENIGTVLEHNENLKIYRHFCHFGLMFFYRQLTRYEIYYGPTIQAQYDRGEACCF